MSFYYPYDSESFLINMFIIYPQRAAFDIFYFNHKNKFLNIIKIIFLFLITILFGIPFFIIKSIILLIFTRSYSRTWSYLSKYHNRTILTIDNTIITNMKHFLSYLGMNNTSINKATENNINKCLIKTYHDKLGKIYSYHGVAYDKTTHIGVIYTSKKQEQIAHIRYLNGTYVYSHKFLNNEFIDNINNEELKQLLLVSGTIDVLRSHYNILKSQWIILNENNRQSLIEINKKIRNDAIHVINAHGGIKKVENAFEFQDNYELIINNALNLIKDLGNSTNTFKKPLMSEKEKIYQQLCDYKEILPNSDKILTINKLLESFDKFHDSF